MVRVSAVGTGNESHCRSMEQRSKSVTVLSVLARLMLLVLVFFVFYTSRRRTAQPEAVISAQMICPHCGRITPRIGTRCLECGGPLIS